MKLLAALLFAALALAPAPALAAETVYVVRHLEKAEGDDPPLSVKGAANAQRLAHMLGDKGIVAIFATPTKRAMETAAPLAKRLGIAVTAYDPKAPDALVESAAVSPGAILVIGHSNTVPALVAAFGGAKPAPMTEEDYGTIFVVEDGSVATLAVR